MGLVLSNNAQQLIADCRKIAEKYKTDFIGISHFYLIYNMYRNKNDEKMSVSELKPYISYLRNSYDPNFDITKSIPLTIEFENTLKFANLLTWILDEECIDVHHLLLFLTKTIKTAEEYITYIEDKQIAISAFQKFILKIYFNPLGKIIVKYFILRERQF